MNFVKPIYPKKARLAHIEGVVKLHLVFADDGSIAELQPVSGDPLLVDSAMKAVQEWRVSFGRAAGRPMEHEIALSLTFSIEDPPKPAYLHLTNGDVIRADTVREFEDRIEYTVGPQTHNISPDSVTNINACARVSVLLTMKEGDCVPGGGPTFNIRAIPLLPSQSAPVAHARQPFRIRVNEDIQKAKLVHMLPPLYPPFTGKRMDGTVILHVIIGKNGVVKRARYASGPLNLEDSAIKAVLQWQYAPTLVNGVAVQVDATVSVAFPPPVKSEPTARSN
jgi:TonB family protein